MRPKVALSTAWAERLGFSDKDLCGLFDIDLASAREAREFHFCPHCGLEAEDSNFNFYVYEPSRLPEESLGVEYVGCLCGTTYYRGFRNVRHHRTLEDLEQEPPAPNSSP